MWKKKKETVCIQISTSCTYYDLFTANTSSLRGRETARLISATDRQAYINKLHMVLR